jgi:uncharacterized protein
MINKTIITLAITFLMILPLAIAVPEYKGYVTDNANVLGEWAPQIEELIKEIEKNTTAEIAVLTIDSLEGRNLEEYSLEIAQSWGVGKKDKDNGLLILISYKDKKYRFETGYGLEGTLPDAKTGRIGRTILTPYFQQGKYGQGVYEAVKEIQGLLANDPSIIAKYAEDKSEAYMGFAAIGYGLGFIALLVITEKSKKHKWKIRAGVDILVLIGSIFLGAVFFAMAAVMSILFWVIAFQIFFALKFGGKKGKNHWWGTFNSDSSSSGSSFGGFGGGSFGGGGSSGSW